MCACACGGRGERREGCEGGLHSHQTTIFSPRENTFPHEVVFHSRMPVIPSTFTFTFTLPSVFTKSTFLQAPFHLPLCSLFRTCNQLVPALVFFLILFWIRMAPCRWWCSSTTRSPVPHDTAPVADAVAATKEEERERKKKRVEMSCFAFSANVRPSVNRQSQLSHNSKVKLQLLSTSTTDPFPNSEIPNPSLPHSRTTSSPPSVKRGRDEMERH